MSPIRFLLGLGLLFWNFPKYDTAINNNVIRICTATDEDHENCTAMKKIADGEGIHPSIECVQLKTKSRDTYECIDEVFSGENSTTRADVTFISSDEIYTAKKSNLTLIHLLTKWVKTVLVVNPAEVKNLSDLKGKRACFSKYMDGAYVSVSYVLNDKMDVSDTCMFDVRLTKHVGPACTPGFQDAYFKADVKILDPFEGNGPCTLCHGINSITSRQCNYNTTVNLYAGREGALDCLSYTGHFTAITLDDNTILPNGMKLMCKNGTLSDTLDVDDHCYLMELPSEVIVIRADHPQLTAIQETLGHVMRASRTVRGEFIQIPKNGFVNNEKQGKFMEFFGSIDKCPPEPKELSQSSGVQIAIIIGVVVLVVATVVVLGYYGYRHYNICGISRNARRQNTDLKGPEETKVPELNNPEEVPLTILNPNHNADQN